MDLHLLILENKFLLEALYTFAISMICMVVVIKTDRIFRLSLHHGLRYFRNAFFFFGIAFVTRYIFGIFSDLSFPYTSFVKVIFEYFFIMAGFFLIYSLIWKKFESSGTTYASSLINARIAIFHAMALILAVMDSVWQTYLFMFISQALIFFYASVVAYRKNKEDNGEHKFLRFYFIAMLMSFSAWVLNLLVASVFHWDHTLMVNIGMLNIIFFLLFLYGVIKVTQKQK